LKMWYFLINSLKMAMSVRRSVIIHQTSAFFILSAETSLYYSAIFVGEDARFGFVPRCRYPRYATDTHTLLWKVCNYIEQTKLYLPAVYQERMKESRKVLSPKDNKWDFRLFSHTTSWTSKRKSVNTH